MRGLLIAATPLVAAAMLFLAPTIARADSASSLTVVGTSDVSDSGLMQNVIQPRFHAAFPQYTFKYIGTATGTAINSAESGSQGASVLIVHAPSLENQFVGNGFSEEPFGRAIWINDFVLAGPTADPARVGGRRLQQHRPGVRRRRQGWHQWRRHAGGDVRLPRRYAPARPSQEHQIWALVDSHGLPPTGLLLCAFSAANGGGETPIAPEQRRDRERPAMPEQRCDPDRGGAALVVRDDRPHPGPERRQRERVQRLPERRQHLLRVHRPRHVRLPVGRQRCRRSEQPGGIPNLKILTRGPQPASAPGGAFALANYFHAYIINPSKPNETVNLTAAQDFVNLITSPDVQGQLQFYLNSTDRPGRTAVRRRRLADDHGNRAPAYRNRRPRRHGHRHGHEREPGFAAIDHKPVSVNELVGGLPIPVGSGTTDSSGHYSVRFTPTSSGSYQVSTGPIQQIENATLTPAFGDILSPAASNAATMNVQSAVALSTAKPSAGGFTVTGKLAPGAPDSNGRVTLLARPQGSKRAFSEVGGGSLTTGQSTFAFNGGVRPGKWQVEARYSDPGRLLSSTSTSRRTSPCSAVGHDGELHKIAVSTAT